MKEHLTGMLTAYKRTSAFLACNNIGIFKVLNNNSLTLEALSAGISADPSVLGLLLEYLRSEGILIKNNSLWCLSEEYKNIDTVLEELSGIINHETQLYKKWITPEILEACVMQGYGNRAFDKEGLSNGGEEIYNKAMYGKNMDMIAFWLKRQLRGFDNISLLGFGRSNGSVAMALKKQLTSLKAFHTTNVNSFLHDTRYNATCIYNSIHYYPKKTLLEILEKIRISLIPGAVLCIADVFFDNDDKFLQGILLDWITHGGVYNIFKDEVIELLSHAGFENIKHKKLKEISTDMIFCIA